MKKLIILISLAILGVNSTNYAASANAEGKKKTQADYFIIRFQTRNAKEKENKFLTREIKFFDHDIKNSYYANGFFGFQDFPQIPLMNTELGPTIKEDIDIILSYPLYYDKSKIKDFIPGFFGFFDDSMDTNSKGLIKIKPGKKYVIQLPINYKDRDTKKYKPACLPNEHLNWAPRSSFEKVSSPPICVQEIDIKEEQKKVAAKVHEALPQMPKEIAGIISEYTT